MDYRIKIAGQALIATVSGELDLHTAPEFKTQIDAQLSAQPQIRYLIFEVKGLTFIDSSGLGMILGRYRQLQDRAGKLYFVDANPQIARILRMSGFPKISEFAGSTSEVLARVQKTV